MDISAVLEQEAELLKRCAGSRAVTGARTLRADARARARARELWACGCVAGLTRSARGVVRSMGVEMDSDTVMMVNVGIIIVLASIILCAWFCDMRVGRRAATWVARAFGFSAARMDSHVPCSHSALALRRWPQWRDRGRGTADRAAGRGQDCAIPAGACTFRASRFYLWVSGNAWAAVVPPQLQFGRVRQTVTSMMENQCSVVDKGTSVPLIDVPGHPRLRESIRGKYAKQAKRVVFVIDSKEFKDTSRETAEYVASGACALQQHAPIAPGTARCACVAKLLTAALCVRTVYC